MRGEGSSPTLVIALGNQEGQLDYGRRQQETGYQEGRGQNERLRVSDGDEEVAI